MLGLPDHVKACLFDLDGVLTDTASVHTKAWTAMFDEYLRDRATRTGEPFQPFDPVADYQQYVDGRPRDDGVRTFLASRGIELDAETVADLGDRKNAAFQQALHRDGVQVFEDGRSYLAAAADAGLAIAVVSSSANTQDVLEITGLARFVQQRVDGVTIREQHLRGKPAPDSFLLGAQRLGVTPEAAAVFEDALSGVAAGRAGHFGIVVGVDRVGHAAELRSHGADVVVQSLEELL